MMRHEATMQVIRYAEPPVEPALTPPVDSCKLAGGMIVALAALPATLALRTFLSSILFGPAGTSRLTRNVPEIVVWMLLSMGIIATGFGSIRVRRWSRAVVLSACGLMMASGVITLLVVTVLDATTPTPFVKLEQTGSGVLSATFVPGSNSAADAGDMLVIKCGIFGFLIALPLFLFLIYRSRKVTEAFETADDRVRWTDALPLRVIALAMGLGGVCGVILMAMFYMPPMPARFVSGDAAEARVFLGGGMIVLAVLYAWSAWMMLHLRPFAPWLALMLIVLTAGGSIAAMHQPALRNSFGRDDFAWPLQLTTARGVFAVAAYAIPAAIYVLHVRWILRRQPAAAPEGRA
jgi:hypothetical protein